MQVKFKFDGQPLASCFGSALDALLEGELVDLADANEFLGEVASCQKNWRGNIVVVEFEDGVANIYLGADPYFNPINIRAGSLTLLVSKWVEFLKIKRDMEFDIVL